MSTFGSSLEPQELLNQAPKGKLGTLDGSIAILPSKSCSPSTYALQLSVFGRHQETNCSNSSHAAGVQGMGWGWGQNQWSEHQNWCTGEVKSHSLPPPW